MKLAIAVAILLGGALSLPSFFSPPASVKIQEYNVHWKKDDRMVTVKAGENVFITVQSVDNQLIAIKDDNILFEYQWTEKDPVRNKKHKVPNIVQPGDYYVHLIGANLPSGEPNPHDFQFDIVTDSPTDPQDFKVDSYEGQQAGLVYYFRLHIKVVP